MCQSRHRDRLDVVRRDIAAAVEGSACSRQFYQRLHAPGAGAGVDLGAAARGVHQCRAVGDDGLGDEHILQGCLQGRHRGRVDDYLQWLMQDTAQTIVNDLGFVPLQ